MVDGLVRKCTICDTDLVDVLEEASMYLGFAMVEVKCPKCNYITGRFSIKEGMNDRYVSTKDIKTSD